jgi:ketosteroid isomerase-like protein
MSTEENKALVRRFLDAQHQGNLSLMEELMAPDFILYLPNSPQPMERAGTTYFFAMFHAAFPDERYTIEDQVADGERHQGDDSRDELSRKGWSYIFKVRSPVRDRTLSRGQMSRSID